MKYISFLLISLSLFSNCNSAKTGKTSDKAAQTTPELSGTYMVQTLYGEDISEHKLTMIFDPTNKSLSGFSGCNEYSCNYIAEEEKFSSGFPMATKRYCEKTGKIEKQFFKAMSEMKSKSITKTTLGFKNEQKQEIVIAKKAK